VWNIHFVFWQLERTMQNFLEFSSVVDSVRSNAGSALKSVQRQFEEKALKAAGLGEDEESLYLLNKHTQAYLRAADAMQQAATALADDFSTAMEDLAMRDIARKFRDSSKSANATQISALQKELAEPIRQACAANDDAIRRQLVNKAFVGLLDTNLDCFRSVSTSMEEAHSQAQKALKDIAKPKAMGSPSKPSPDMDMGHSKSSPTSKAGAGYAHRASVPSVPAANDVSRHDQYTRARAKTLPSVSTPTAASFDDLLGDVAGGSASKAAPKENGTGDLLDFGFDAPSTSAGGVGPSVASTPPRAAETSSSMFDLQFDADSVLNSGIGTKTPCERAPAPVAPDTKRNSLGSLDGLAWTSKEDEDESCIKARVDHWQQGKNLRTMLVTLHQVAPSSSEWQQVQLGDLQTPADVKAVYRKAVLAVHPDKNQGKSGEKMLAHHVFQALCEQWNVFRTSR
jgi:hypothetical protein